LLKSSEADWIFIPEGEKHCDRLYSLWLIATCNVGGAEKWTQDLNPYFENKKAAILPDNDPPGKKHVQKVAQNLYPFAKEIRIIELQGLPPKGDIIDWLNAGHSKEELLKIVEKAKPWVPGEPKTEVDGKEEILDNRDKKTTQSQSLITLAEEAGLFKTPDEKVFANILINEHTEIWLVRTKEFRRWLSYKFYRQEGKPPGEQAFQDALGIIEAKGLYDSPTLPVFTRVAELNGNIYLDLVNGDWEVVEITKEGWRTINDSPVKFRRSRGMLSLPHPSKNGSLEDLKSFINITDEKDWKLFLSWLIVALRPKGPYPILILQGEQGSAKTFTCRLARSIIDPSTALLRTAPREERDLMIAAHNSWIVAFDNLSSLPPWLSDALCRLSTGGGFSKRQNYTDEEEIIFNVMRPIILNGIDSIVTRNDLADRSIIINLPSIPEDKRKTENEIQQEFNRKLPGILGALCDVVCGILKNISFTTLPELPRMADFAKWVTAGEPALSWKKGEFSKIYRGKIAEVIELALDTDIVASTVRSFAEEKAENKWEGTATELLEILNRRVPDSIRKLKSWPKKSHVLSSRLKRAATFLRAKDIDIYFGGRESGTGRRFIIIRKRRGRSVTSVTVSQNKGKLIENNGEKACDACDDNFPFYSKGLKPY
jgi:hypothetical protein